MRVKVLCLGRGAKQLDVEEGSTVSQAIRQSGYPKDDSYQRFLNGSPAFDSDTLTDGACVTLVPEVKGGV